MTGAKRRVLIVDHPRFSGLISKMLQGSFETATAADGLEAIGRLTDEPPSVVVIEESLPGSGIRLAELVGMSPRTAHIPVVLTSTRPSPEMIIRARNAGVSSFLAKPFRPSDLIGRIETALRAMAERAASLAPAAAGTAAGLPRTGEAPGTPADRSAAFRDRVKQIDGLPSFPATHAEIMKLARSEEASSDLLAEKIQLDPSFLAQVLKLSNSSCYGFRKKINSLSLAVTLIGMEEIANLVMTAQVFERLGRYQGGGGLDLPGFWRHSVGTAFIARAVAKKLQAEVETAFLGGLLHDLGKVVLDRYFGDYYAAVFREVKGRGIPILQAERDVLGVGHEEIGVQLAQEWKFPDNYASCIENHHDPMNARRYARLVRVVHIADALCRKIGFGSGGDDNVPEIDARVLESFAIAGRGVDILEEAARADLGSAESFLAELSG